jgi:hypothetical protein
MRTLKIMVGEMIILRTPALDQNELSLVKLHAVEARGIWIESQEFTEGMMEKLKLASSSTTLVLFVPFERIDYVVGSIHALSLSEKSFGLTGDD